MLGAVLLLGTALGSCRQGDTQPDVSQESGAPPQPVVLTTFTVLADMAQNVAGERIKVESLTRPGAEVHGYQPTPSDLVRASNATLILDNGFGLERWADRFYSSLKGVPRATLSEGVTPVLIAEDAYAGQPNPHAWMSPQNALVYVENIRKAIARIDPANAATYEANAQAYAQQIRALDQTLRKAIAAVPPPQRYLVTCEGAFSYLARDYGLKELYLWPVNAEQQGTPQQLRRVTDQVKANQVPAVFCESTVNSEAQKQIARQTGARFGGVLYVDSLSAVDGVAPTYLKLLKYNINTLITGLKGG